MILVLLMEAKAIDVSLWECLKLGWRRLCPRCGQGKVYGSWRKRHSRCASCDLQYLRNEGDTWGLLLLVDRALFIFPPIIALFLGLHEFSIVLYALYGLTNTILILLTIPHRYGLCLGIDYFTRVRWPDPDDKTVDQLPGLE